MGWRTEYDILLEDLARELNDPNKLELFENEEYFHEAVRHFVLYCSNFLNLDPLQLANSDGYTIASFTSFYETCTKDYLRTLTRNSLKSDIDPQAFVLPFLNLLSVRFALLDANSLIDHLAHHHRSFMQSSQSDAFTRAIDEKGVIWRNISKWLKAPDQHTKSFKIHLSQPIVTTEDETSALLNKLFRNFEPNLKSKYSQEVYGAIKQFNSNLEYEHFVLAMDGNGPRIRLNLKQITLIRIFRYLLEKVYFKESLQVRDLVKIIVDSFEINDASGYKLPTESTVLRRLKGSLDGELGNGADSDSNYQKFIKLIKS